MPKSKRCRVCGSSDTHIHSSRNPAGWSDEFRKQLQQLYPNIFPSLPSAYCVLCCKHFQRHRHKANGKTLRPDLLKLRYTPEASYELSGRGRKCAVCQNTRDTVRLHKPPEGGWSYDDLHVLKNVNGLSALPPKNALLCCNHFEAHEDDYGSGKRPRLVVKTTMATRRHTRSVSSPSNVSRKKRMKGATSFSVREKRTREERTGLKREEKRRKKEERKRSELEKLDKSVLIDKLLELQKNANQRTGLGVTFNWLPDNVHASQFGFSCMEAFRQFRNVVSPYKISLQTRSTNRYDFDVALKMTMLMLRKGDSYTQLFYLLPPKYQTEPPKQGSCL